MRIAIMMRALDQDSGFRAFTENLVRYMLRLDSDNSYLLMYRSTKWLGRFAEFPNAREVLVGPPHKLAWDQMAVPYTAWRARADVILNPKFTIPLVSHCPVVMGLQEPAWWVWPQHYEQWDVRYMRLMLPLYCRKAVHLFAWSNFVVDESRRYLGLPFENATVTYPAASDYFRVIDDTAALAKFRSKHNLPARFILTVTRVDHVGLEGSTSLYAGKNVETSLRAYLLCREQIPHKLVLAGRKVHEYLLAKGWSEEALEGVYFTGFVPHEELPLLYNLADLFVMPSLYEGFGFTLVEAMASGCPAVVAQAGACPEVAGGAAVLADPLNPSDFAAKILTVLHDPEMRQTMRARGRERAGSFSWEQTAKVTLDVLTRVVHEAQRDGRERPGALPY